MLGHTEAQMNEMKLGHVHTQHHPTRKGSLVCHRDVIALIVPFGPPNAAITPPSADQDVRKGLHEP